MTWQDESSDVSASSIPTPSRRSTHILIAPGDSRTVQHFAPRWLDSAPAGNRVLASAFSGSSTQDRGGSSKYMTDASARCKEECAGFSEAVTHDMRMSYIPMTIERRTTAGLPETTVCAPSAGAALGSRDTQFSYCRYFRAIGARQHTPHLAASQAPCPYGTRARTHFAR
jgi:hypothetical protein